MQSGHQIFVALDMPDLGAVLPLVEKLAEHVGGFKIGTELFTAHGPEAVLQVQRRSGRAFLDLKFHDIPNTVRRSSREAAKLGVSLFNVHCLGGIEMMRAARQGVSDYMPDRLLHPLILGVTILTSHDYPSLLRHGLVKHWREVFDRIVWDEDGIAEKKFQQDQVQRLVLALAADAYEAALDGVVASPQEIRIIREEFGPKFLIIAPGIRFADSSTDDQQRIATPGAAIAAGADYIVMGRPILNAKDPLDAVKRAADEIAQAIHERR